MNNNNYNNSSRQKKKVRAREREGRMLFCVKAAIFCKDL